MKRDKHFMRARRLVLAGSVVGLALGAGVVSPVLAGSPLTAAAGRTAAPASLMAAIRSSLGISASAVGYSQTAELTAANAAPGASLGASVALSSSGTTALVGATYPSFPSPDAGAAYVFTLRGGTWSQTAELTASDGAPGDLFGSSVALSASGTTALVGAPSAAAPGPGGAGSATYGAAYVFSLRGGTWSQTAKLTALQPASGEHDYVGGSVALSSSGTTALVGSPFGFPAGGHAFVFTRRGGTWSQTAELTASGNATDNLFAWSVALSSSGSTALVGARLPNSDAGAAYVFTRRGGTWSQTAELTASDGAPGDQFGFSVALSALGRTALVGVYGRGAAYVFTLRGGTWSQTAELTVPKNVSVALSALGSTAEVGADFANSAAGAAYVFTLRGGTWSQTAELTASDAAPYDAFGVSVALSALGSTALVGAPGHSVAGSAYVFTAGGG